VSGYVDAHHHIWRVQDLPWLSGPMIPRIFGPYESLQQRDYLAAEYGQAAAANGFTQSVYTQANWPLERSLDEVEWVHAQHVETGWPTAIVGSADLFSASAYETLEAQADATPLMRGTRLQLHWHEHDAFKFATAPDRMLDRVFNENLKRVADLGWVFELQVFPNQLEGARELLAAHPDLTFVLIHAGMPIEGEPWREFLAALAEHPNLNVKLSGQGTFIHRVDPDWIQTVTQHVVDTFGSERAMFGSNFPVESLWTDFSSLVQAWFGVLAGFPQDVQDDILGRTARRIYRLAEEATP
jgi:predicted TIM-barrel fold metal-dependent hydrolase